MTIQQAATIEAKRLHKAGEQHSGIKFTPRGKHKAIASIARWLLRKDNPWYMAETGPWGRWGPNAKSLYK
jgi:hypothetical protein